MLKTVDHTSKAKKGCKFCGSKTVAWEQAEKTGKWYLCEVFDHDGVDRYDTRDFHSTYCKKAALHDKKQNQISGRQESAREEELELRTKAEQRQATEIAARVLELARMTEQEKVLRLSELENLGIQTAEADLEIAVLKGLLWPELHQDEDTP